MRIFLFGRILSFHSFPERKNLTYLTERMLTCVGEVRLHRNKTDSKISKPGFATLALTKALRFLHLSTAQTRQNNTNKTNKELKWKSPLTGKQPLHNRLFECHAQHSIQYRARFSHVNQRFHVQSIELTE